MQAKPEIPLGKPETDRLEFKGAKALENLRSLARAVVALLNARGGQLWIGLAEHEGVAAKVEPIAGLRAQATRLQNGLIDLVEPAPILGEEIEIVPVLFSEGADEGLLRVDVKRGRRAPYAFLDRMLRGYVVRSGSRTLGMTREEIRSRFSSGREGDIREDVTGALLEESKTAAGSFQGLQLSVQPAVEDFELPVDRDTLLRMMRDPGETGNRPMGWVFTDSGAEVRPTKGGYAIWVSSSREHMLILRNGHIRYREMLERLVWKGIQKEIWPYALAEYPTSVLRLARRLYQTLDPETPIVTALAMLGIKGWSLRPHSPRAVGYQFAQPSPFDEAVIIPEPLIVAAKELQDSPDRCAFRLLVRIYEAFGYFEDDLPSEFSRETGTLTIAS